MIRFLAILRPVFGVSSSFSETSSISSFTMSLRLAGSAAGLRAVSPQLRRFLCSCKVFLNHDRQKKPAP